MAATSFSAGAAAKIRRAVTGYLNDPGDLTGSRNGKNVSTDIIEAKLTSRDGTDTSLYSWTQAQRNGTGWDDLTTTGLSGTTTARPAIDMRPSGLRFNATGKYVLLKRGARKIMVDDGGGGTTTSLETVWFIVGDFEGIGMYQYFVKQNLTDTTVGYAPVKAAPLYT